MSRILVIGDLIIDEYTHGRKLGVSAETPTVVAEYEKNEIFAGGAGLVVRHLIRLGNVVDFITVTNMPHIDVDGYFSEHSSDPLSTEEMSRLNLKLFRFDGWEVTTKRRYYVDDYKMVQYDTLNKGKWDDRKLEIFKQYVDSSIQKSEDVVICDNRHGVLGKDMPETIIELCKKYNKTCYVDSQVSQSTSNIEKYKNADFFFLNEKELRAVTCFGDGGNIKDNLLLAKKKLNGEIIVKLGKDGASYLDINNDIVNIPSFPVDVVDTCGAGDAFLSSFVSKGDIMEANRWAALSTTYKGTIVPKL